MIFFRLILTAIWLTLPFFSCTNEEQKDLRQNKQTLETGEYFSVNSMLDSQMLVLRGKSLLKKESSGGEVSKNSSDFKKEFQIFRNFDINKPVWKGEFKVTKDGKFTIYTPESSKINVKQLKTLYSNGKLVFFSGTYIDENLLYRIEKNVAIKFENGVMTQYRLQGKQKIIFMEEFQFRTDCFLQN
jgi:hypothetical protein